MDPRDAKKIIESILFITEQPLSLRQLEGLFEKEFSKVQIEEFVRELTADYVERGSAVEVREIGGGWQLATRPEFAPFIRRLFKDRLSYRLSQSALETLTIVAYKQPITRAEIEEIRGVEVSAVLDTLVDRKLARVAGRKETLGRPLLYGTTPDFLRAFGLRRLEDLPALDSLTPPSTEAVTAATDHAAVVAAQAEADTEARATSLPTSSEPSAAAEEAIPERQKESQTV